MKGRRTITTGSLRSRAASILAEAASPPALRATTMSMRCVRQHRTIAGEIERAARHDHLRALQRQRRARRIDQPQQIGVLRMRGEEFEMLPADAEKYPARRRAQRLGRRREIIDLDPVVAGTAFPRRALQRQQRHLGDRAGGHRMRADLRSEWMGGIDDARDPLGAKIIHQAIDAAEAADTPGDRRRRRVLGASGIGQHRIDVRRLRNRRHQPVGVGGTAKDQDAQALGRRGCHDRKR